MNDTLVPESIPYATPSASSGRRVAPAVWIALIGLALIGLGGCFCIGIMETLTPEVGLYGVITTTLAKSAGVLVFLIFLYAAAFCCFIAGAFLLARGVIMLSKMMNR